MFAASFGLTDNPFKITPNLRFVYLGENFQQVRAEAARAAATRNGVVLLTSRAGVGKSILLRLLAGDLEETDAVGRTLSLSCSPGSTIDDLARQAFGVIEWPSGNGSDGLDRLIADCIATKQAAILLVDEAQNLSDHEIGRLFLMVDQVDHRGGRLSIVLAGPVELERRLEAALSGDFQRRIILRRRLDPLSENEVAAFVAERLETAGCPRTDLFSTDAIARIARYSGGVPRLVNTLCATALFLAEFESRHMVTADVVDEAARHAELVPPQPASRAVVPAPRRAASAADSSARPDRLLLPARIERLELLASRATESSGIVIQPDLLQPSRSTIARSRSWPGLLFGASAAAAALVAAFVAVQKPELVTGVTDRLANLPLADLTPSDPAPTPTADTGAPPEEPVVAAKTEPAAGKADGTASAPAATAPRPGASEAPTAAPRPQNQVQPPPAPSVDSKALAELGAGPEETVTAGAEPIGKVARLPDPAPAKPPVKARADTDASRATDGGTPGAAQAPARAPAASAEPAPARDAATPAEKQKSSPPVAKADGAAAPAPEPAPSAASPKSVTPDATPPAASAGAKDPTEPEPAVAAADAPTAATEGPPAPEAAAPAPQKEVPQETAQNSGTAPVPAAKSKAADNGTTETAALPEPAQAPAAPAEGSAAPGPAGSKAALVADLLERGRRQVEALALTTPKGANALETYQQVLAIEPGNEQAQQGLQDIADKYVVLAHSAERKGQPDRAHRYYQKVAAILPNHPALMQQQAAAAPENAVRSQPADPATASATPERRPQDSKQNLSELLAQVFDRDGSSSTNAPVPAVAEPSAGPSGPEPTVAAARFPMPPGALENPVRLSAALSAGADPNTRFADGRTPLVIAAAQRRTDLLELLLEHGADPNAATKARGTPLMYSVWNGDPASVEALLKGGAAVNAKNIDGKTALMAAAANGHAEVIGTLLRHGADVNARTLNGWTALMYAVWGRHAVAVSQLLEHGADASIVNEDGDSAASIATERGHFDIANMLRSQQARNE